MSKPIYVVVSCASTKIGKMIRKATRYPYSHVSIAFDPKLSKMYSFARYREKEPFVGGFTVEYPSRYLYGGNIVPIHIYTLNLSDAEYTRIKNKVDYMIKNNGMYIYNLFDAVSTYFGKRCRIPKAYTCIDFAVNLLRIKNVSTIQQLEKKLEKHLSYEGPLDEIINGDFNLYGGGEYFEPVSTLSNVKDTAKSVYRLAARKIEEKYHVK